MFKCALVAGGGAFGTSLAKVLSANFEKVLVLVRSKDVYDALKGKENKIYLPGVKIPQNITPILDWPKDLKIDCFVNALPMKAIRTFYQENQNRISEILENQATFISLTKGIDCDTLEFADDIFYSLFPNYKSNFTFLSGPSFAREILEEQITLMSLAGSSRTTLIKSLEMLTTNFVKISPTYDVKGVLIGGALKNVLAISSGIIEGLGYNYNTRAALITKGIKEMLRFSVALNARNETFYGLSGMGDLILTTTGGMSRNKRFGVDIANNGKTIQEIIDEKRDVIEGYGTTKAAYLLSKKFALKTPIFDGAYEVLFNQKDPKSVIAELMKMPSSFEILI